MKLADRYGPWALVTGAAHGLGRSLAQSLASRGLHLVLVDVDEEANDRAGAELSQRYGIDTRCVELDVSATDLAAHAEKLAHDHEIGIVVNNAGISTVEPFFDTDLTDHLRVLETNCRGTLVLTHTLGRAMVARGRGAILIVSSVSALTGTPGVSHYAATKAYGLGLAAGLWGELERSGIDVLALCPGLVRTRGTELDPPALDKAPLVPVMDAIDVAEAAIAALETRRGPVVVAGWHNWLSAFMLSRLAPARLVAPPRPHHEQALPEGSVGFTATPALLGSGTMWPRFFFSWGWLLLAVACGDSSDTSPPGGTGGISTAGTGGTGLSGTGTGTGTGTGSGGGAGAGGASGGTGGGGGSACTPVTLGALELSDTETGGSSLAYTLQGLTPGKEHILFLEFFDQGSPQTVGSFDVSQPPDDNYSTCSHCVLVFENFSDASPTAYYPQSGTIDVAEPDVAYSAESSGTLTGLRLIEVTLNQTVTTPVPDGSCLTLTSAPWDTTP